MPDGQNQVKQLFENEFAFNVSNFLPIHFVRKYNVDKELSWFCGVL
jgi:hypothetical protein